MRSPAYLAHPNVQRLPSLLREIQEGEIRIPRFQRPFVWTDEQRLDLFRSIYDGIPIGSILVWRTKDHVLKCYDHVGHLPLAWYFRGEEEERRQVRQYVLDGHQRLTTLFDALGAGLVTADQVAEKTATVVDTEETQADRTWPIYFDLEEKTFQIHRRSGEPPDTWLPLSILLDPYKLFAFQRRLPDRGSDRVLINRTEALASTFKDYSLPVVPIATESLELATESFQRVNSVGTPMNQVHMVSALTWTPEFDLNERLREIQTELGDVGWQDLDEQMILNTCKAALDLDIYYAEAKEIRDALKERPEVLEEARSSLRKASIFLREHCKIYGPAVLPYSYQVVLLADALRIAGEPPQEVQAKLTTWFWLTTYSEHFGGISAGRLARTLEHLRAVVIQGAHPEPPDLARTVTPLQRFDFRTARSRAVALRMAELQARHGGVPEYDPFQLLADYGREAIPTLFASREVKHRFTEGPENRILVHPREASRIRRLLSDPACERNLHASFAVDENARAALSKGDLSYFLASRRMAILRFEEDFLESLGSLSLDF